MASSNPFQRFARPQAPAVPRTDARSSSSVSKRKRVSSPHDELVRVGRHPDLGLVEQTSVKVETAASKDDDGTRVKKEAHGAEEDDEAHGGTREVSLARREILLEQLVAARRSGGLAPIDCFGTQACIAEGVAHAPTRRFQLLVAALLSSQTQDAITHAAMMRLHTQLVDPTTSIDDRNSIRSGTTSVEDDGLTIAKVRKVSTERITELLVPVGFYRRKAQHIKQVAEMLHSRHRDDVPRELDALLELPGIGPKIARVILLLAWDRVDGIIVDTHVHRLAQRLGWIDHGQRKGVATPEDTRAALEDWVPRRFWRDFSRDVVGFGQTVCAAVNPRCLECPLAPLCPSAFKSNAMTKPRRKKAGTKAIAITNPRRVDCTTTEAHQDPINDSDDFKQE